MPDTRLDWAREEDILAMDFYVTVSGLNGASIPGQRSAEVSRLSDLLRLLSAYPREVQGETYGNPNGSAR